MVYCFYFFINIVRKKNKRQSSFYWTFSFLQLFCRFLLLSFDPDSQPNVEGVFYIACSACDVYDVQSSICLFPAFLYRASYHDKRQEVQSQKCTTFRNSCLPDLGI